MSMKKSAAEGVIRVSGDTRGVDVEVPFKTKRRCVRVIRFFPAILFRKAARVTLTRGQQQKNATFTVCLLCYR
jgi:hypothetical protein